MNADIQGQVVGFGDRLVAYLPNLVAGLALLLVGWLCSWLAKKLIVQLARLLRLDRYFSRSRWGAELRKADVRRGLYDIAGNAVFAIVFLVFLDNAFIAWKLTIFSELLGKAILFLPKLVVAGVVFGAGWLIASWTQGAVQRTLRREGFARATLASLAAKGFVVVFFSAMALEVAEVAREIVVIATAAVFFALAAAATVLAFWGGKAYFERKRDGEGKEESKREG